MHIEFKISTNARINPSQFVNDAEPTGAMGEYNGNSSYVNQNLFIKSSTKLLVFICSKKGKNYTRHKDYYRKGKTFTIYDHIRTINNDAANQRNQ